MKYTLYVHRNEKGIRLYRSDKYYGVYLDCNEDEANVYFERDGQIKWISDTIINPRIEIYRNTTWVRGKRANGVAQAWELIPELPPGFKKDYSADDNKNEDNLKPNPYQNGLPDKVNVDVDWD